MTLGRRRVVVVAVATLVTLALMALTAMGPHVPLIIALGALIGGLAYLAADLDAVAARADKPAPSALISGGAADRQVSSLRNRLAYRADDAYVAEHLHRSLVELIDDQLVSAHGIDRIADPHAARAIIGDELHEFVTADEPPRLMSNTRRLAEIVGQIERL